jgi:hypothetical protein
MKTGRTHLPIGPFAPVALPPSPTLRWTAVVSREAGRRAVIAAALVIGGSSSVFACPFCFGAEETSLVDGTKLGILAMLAVVLVVQGAFAGFFFYLRRRAKLIAEMDLDSEWSELQGGASRL